MIILVTMRITDNSTYLELRDAISHDWIRALDKLGVTPVLVPNVLKDPAMYLRAVGARGLILTGGDDLGDLSRASGESLGARERTECALLRMASEKKLPVFGVCRGLQLINAFFGGGQSKCAAIAGRHVGTGHSVEVLSSVISGLAAGARVDVNSYHAHGVSADDLAPDLKAFAISEDGLVEGLYHPRLPLYAVQWHPERKSPDAISGMALIKGWLSQCA